MTDAPPGTGPTSLLATKLHAPRPRRELVDRARLTDRLSVGSLPSLTLVSAPAGFGKTTLLADWIARIRREGEAVTWLALDSGDNDPARFWSYVVAAIRTVDTAVGDDALRLLQGTETTFAAVTSLLNDLAAVGSDLTVVVDDYHVVESPEVHEALAFLIEHLPAQVHLVLAGRADPPLPLARLRARGELLEIRAADLRFTAGEAAAYLNGSMGLGLDETEVGTLDARTEGWIAALQLAALSIQGRTDTGGFIATFAGDDRFVVDFLAEEVLERQTEEVRAFLLETAVLDRFTAATCDAVTGRAGGRGMLETLDRANLFLVPLDDRRQWYRYHHLFADVLRARLLDERPEDLPELHRRASEWFEAEGDLTDAVGHALAADDVDRAARLIELAAPGLQQARQEATLQAWLEALPDEAFTQRPVLTMALVGARLSTHDPAGVEHLLELIEAALEGPIPPIAADPHQLARLPTELLVHRAGLRLQAGDYEGTIPLAQQVLDRVEPGDDRLLGVASALMGLGCWGAGNLLGAERRYGDAVDAFEAAGHRPDMLACSLTLGDLQIALGRLGAARQTFERGLRTTARHPGLRGAADMHVGLSEVLIEHDDLDVAAEHLAAGRALGPAAGFPQHPYRWRVTMARLCRARGDLDQALALLDEAEPLYETDFSPPVRPVPALRARVLLARGDLDAAETWASDRRLSAHDPLDYVREFEHITFVRTVIGRHERDHDPRTIEDALALLGRLEAAAVAGSRIGSLIEILVLRAAALQAGGHHADATAALERALQLAEPEGQVRLFLHSGPGIIALLTSMASDAGYRGSAARVLARIAPPAGSPPSVPAAPTLVDPLSARELDVLRMLRSELSGPEIADEMLVSLNTVRTHTRNIYTKLGVRNRREAVRRAAELGL